MVGEVGQHNMRIVGKPRLCENFMLCLHPEDRIQIRYGYGCGRVQSCCILSGCRYVCNQNVYMWFGYGYSRI